MARKRTRNSSRKKRRAKKGAGRRWLWRLAALLLVAAVAGVTILDIIVRNRFAGAKWELPAHVYSRSLELYEGRELALADLRWELEQLGYRQVDRVRGPGQYRLTGPQLVLHTRPFRFWDGDEPARRLRLAFGNGKLRTMDVAGNRMSLVRLEPLAIGGIYPDHAEDRVLVRLEQLPPYLVDGLIAVEDRDFYDHRGVSPRAIARAFLANLKAGATVQGGSTITQQLVKNFYLTRERSLVRKGLEAVMALLLELHYSKGEILEAYINEVYLGQSGNRAIHGFGQASRHYFRQPIGELEPHQVALLVALVKGASYYDPWRHPERSRGRRNLVLEIFRDQGLIDENVAREAKSRPLGVAERPGSSANPYPDYLDLVRRQLARDYREQDIRTAGLRIFTHFDPQVQRRVEQSIASVLTSLESGYRLEPNSLQAASLVVRTGTADVLALAGGRKAGYAGFNRALEARRQVGSTIKPAVYLAALARESDFTLTTPIDDSPLSVATENGETWSPRNFERESHGWVPLYEALAQSYNQATARLGMELGLDSVAATIRGLGYDGPLNPVPSMLLGSTAMAPFEVAEMYHTIAAEGFHSPLRAIRSVYDADNNPLKRYGFETEQRFDPATMHLLQYGLQAATREGTGTGVYRYLPDDVAAAGKTGTSNGQRDSWFAGFVDDYVGVVWVGRDDNGRMPLTGGTGALQVWADAMAGLDVASLPFVKPEEVEYHWVEPYRQRLSGEGCQGARFIPYIRGTAPERKGPCHRPPGREIIDWFKDVFGL